MQHVPADVYLTARYNSASLTTLLSLIMMVGMFGASMFGKNLSDRFGKAKTCIYGLILSIAGLVLRIVTADYNLAVIIAGIFMYSVGAALFMACLWPMVGDAIDYSELKSDMRPESMAYAGVTLISKIGEGISTALLGIALDAIGYVKESAVQSASTVVGLRHLGSTAPLIFMVGMLLVLLTNDMDKKHDEYQKALEQKRSSTRA